jgi:hypothetical protein
VGGLQRRRQRRDGKVPSGKSRMIVGKVRINGDQYNASSTAARPPGR